MAAKAADLSSWAPCQEALVAAAYELLPVWGLFLAGVIVGQVKSRAASACRAVAAGANGGIPTSIPSHPGPPRPAQLLPRTRFGRWANANGPARASSLSGVLARWSQFVLAFHIFIVLRWVPRAPPTAWGRYEVVIGGWGCRGGGRAGRRRQLAVPARQLQPHRRKPPTPPRTLTDRPPQGGLARHLPSRHAARPAARDRAVGVWPRLVVCVARQRAPRLGERGAPRRRRRGARLRVVSRPRPGLLARAEPPPGCRCRAAPPPALLSPALHPHSTPVRRIRPPPLGMSTRRTSRSSSRAPSWTPPWTARPPGS
jgi:hypothetical protein